ncbi:MAG: hypothetical protein KIT28_08020 [Rubrivivax sp.]|nr:hypothetical protein [Rubrivivax sp.]
MRHPDLQEHSHRRRIVVPDPNVVKFVKCVNLVMVVVPRRATCGPRLAAPPDIELEIARRRRPAR